MLSTILMTSLALAQDVPPPPVVGGSTTSDFTPVGSLLAYADGYYPADFCSGTLVAADWVITAAHCIEAAEEYDRYGWDIYFCTGTSLDSDSTIDECDIAVDLVGHPSYNPNSLNADIGVVELSTGLRASGTYPMNTNSPNSFTEDTVTYVGWGITRDGGSDSG
ncbi:MAG: trypsin, partial [Myxococcota bacterium]